MRGFLKGILTGAVLGLLIGSTNKPSRKPGINDLMHMADESPIRKRTGKAIKGMIRSVDKMVKK